LAESGDDVEATLTLCTLFRRTGRLVQAKQQLEVLARFPRACCWSFEIQRELELIERAANATASSNSDSRDRQQSGMPEAA
jgi:hypothetical protein